MAAWIYAAHPVAVLVTGFHGQFDAIVLLFVLLSVVVFPDIVQSVMVGEEL